MGMLLFPDGMHGRQVRTCMLHELLLYVQVFLEHPQSTPEPTMGYSVRL
jgi:hypothetical protein